MNIFGPVPSRRLGISIGINNIPPKHCSYACVYCQLGRALTMSIERQEFFQPDALFAEARDKLRHSRSRGETVDYLTVVPDGEPTLDRNLGALLEKLKTLDCGAAVITNSTLLFMPEVRKDLLAADWVSVKIDAADESVWKKIDRPHRKLGLNSVLEGITLFSKEFQGKLVTETMLIKDLNDGPDALRSTAEFIRKVGPAEAYLGIPTRPPAEAWAIPPNEERINEAFQIYADTIEHVEYLIGYEGNAFPYSGNLEEDILSITAVHPMREDAVEEYVRKAGGDFSSIDKLVTEGGLIASEYNGHRFYVRKLSLPRGK